jgi:hypothetical protein
VDLERGILEVCPAPSKICITNVIQQLPLDLLGLACFDLFDPLDLLGLACFDLFYPLDLLGLACFDLFDPLDLLGLAWI